MRILLLSAYHAASHKQWADGLVKNLPEHDWTLLTLPPRHFSWRIRGNSLTWAFTKQEILAQPYDLILATSMVDLSALRGMSPALTKIPTIVYFHENQFYYPISDNKQSSDSKKSTNNSQVEAQLTSLYSALCADAIVFNTRFNRDSFLDGSENLLKKLPDGIPPDIAQLLKEKSQVIPVPIDPELFTSNSSILSMNNSRFTIVWNHRWEYDKGPDRLLAALKKIPSESALTFHILGQSFRKQPIEFEEIKKLLIQNNWLGEWGYIEDREHYLKTLQESDAVLSTALHDFQGISILEAVATGCTPIVPDRLAYQELFTKEVFYTSYLEINNTNLLYTQKTNQEATALAEKIKQLSESKTLTKGEIKGNRKQDIQHLSWNSMKEKYKDILEKISAQEQ
ncbi:MAG: DUF3524 domain-containing protein [Cellvibrionaceae bacterium]